MKNQMVSGAQAAEENVRIFVAWIAAKTDADYRAMAVRGVLSRTEIAKECGFARSVVNQNPRVREALSSLEKALRGRGVLPAAIDRSAEAASIAVAADRRSAQQMLETERLRRLEQENAGLRAEVAELKRQLKKYAVLRDALAETGRLPR
jgi:cell division protein FtsB